MPLFLGEAGEEYEKRGAEYLRPYPGIITIQKT
jgi:hypothetical protein